MTSVAANTASHSRRLLGPGLISLVIKGASAVLTYGMLVVLARIMSNEEYGRFALGLNLAIILSSLGGIGFATAIMRFWPKHMVAGDTAGARGYTYLGLWGTVLGCSVVGLLALAVVPVAAWLGHDFTFGLAATIALLGLVTSLSDYAGNLLRAMGSVVVSLLPRDVLWRILTPLGAFALLALGYQLSGTAVLFLATILLGLLTLWQIITACRQMPGRTSVNEMRGLWQASKSSVLPLWAAAVIYAMIQQFDVVIVGSLLGTADAGAYFAAQKTALLLSLVLLAANLVTAPTMAALFHDNKIAELQKLCRNVAIAISLATLAGLIFLIVVGKHLLAFFDPAFVSAYPILIILSIGYLVDAMAGPNAYLMQMTSYERHYVWIMVLCYIVVVAAQLILIPLYGAIGAAMASAGGVALWNAAAIIVLRRRAGLDPSILSLLPFKPGR
ncbi:MAG: oligosaccharide flippase family protein [Proteobacteria bacterium]|nr:oligosaccharide flippase family protein [Pseudomonadota bacterium]